MSRVVVMESAQPHTLSLITNTEEEVANQHRLFYTQYFTSDLGKDSNPFRVFCGSHAI